MYNYYDEDDEHDEDDENDEDNENIIRNRDHRRNIIQYIYNGESDGEELPVQG